jgi:hypothetical protein
MNPFFASLGARFATAAGRLGGPVDAPELDPDLAEELLALARAVAHGQERRFAPLATFMAGVAVERARRSWDADAAAQRTLVREVRQELESEQPG